jgi:hypothetical protein
MVCIEAPGRPGGAGDPLRPWCLPQEDLWFATWQLSPEDLESIEIFEARHAVNLRRKMVGLKW